MKKKNHGFNYITYYNVRDNNSFKLKDDGIDILQQYTYQLL